GSGTVTALGQQAWGFVKASAELSTVRAAFDPKGWLKDADRHAKAWGESGDVVRWTAEQWPMLLPVGRVAPEAKVFEKVVTSAERERIAAAAEAVSAARGEMT